jgi:hypothetical protein
MGQKESKVKNNTESSIGWNNIHTPDMSSTYAPRIQLPEGAKQLITELNINSIINPDTTNTMIFSKNLKSYNEPDTMQLFNALDPENYNKKNRSNPVQPKSVSGDLNLRKVLDAEPKDVSVPDTSLFISSSDVAKFLNVTKIQQGGKKQNKHDDVSSGSSTNSTSELLEEDEDDNEDFENLTTDQTQKNEKVIAKKSDKLRSNRALTNTDLSYLSSSAHESRLRKPLRSPTEEKHEEKENVKSNKTKTKILDIKPRKQPKKLNDNMHQPMIKGKKNAKSKLVESTSSYNSPINDNPNNSSISLHTSQINMVSDF